jgi:hypothetical protein
VEAHDSGITSGGSCGLRGDYRRRVVVATNGNGRTEEIKGGRRRGGDCAGGASTAYRGRARLSEEPASRGSHRLSPVKEHGITEMNQSQKNFKCDDGMQICKCIHHQEVTVQPFN